MKKNRYELCGFSCRVKKMLFVMKLTILAFFLGLMSLSAASTYSQNTKITLDLEHMTLIDVFKQIEAQSDFVFIYKNEAINLDKKVDVKIEGATVDKILDQVLQDFGVKYEIIDKQIIITPNHSISSKTEEIKLTEGVSQPGKREISGMIKDPKGIPLPGVSIVIKGTTLGIVSDSEGKFKINVPSESKILVVSFIGMKTQEIIMGNDDSFNITLADEAVGLDEVVAVGYGTQRKGNLTGSIASIKTDKLTIAPISSTINALVGHLPGLVAKQSSGMPGSDASDLSIRGFGNALVIVDGIESTFNNLDANQIESVSILKDGAASIYGARAGNGVILVTTKRGQNQKPTITLNSSYTLQGITKILKPASSGQRSEMERESWIQSGKPEELAPWTADQVAKFYAGNDPAYPNTDWYNYTFRDWAPQQNHNLSICGGSEKISYYGFFGYTDQETMIKKNGGDYSRYNIQSNIDASVTKNLKMSIDLSMAYENRNFPIRGLNNGGAFWQDYYNTKPWYPATLPDPTKVAWGGIDVGSVATVSNIALMGYNLDQRQDFRGTIAFTYDFEKIPGLKAKAFVNYSDIFDYFKNFNKPINFYTYNPANQTYNVAASFNMSSLSEGFGKSKTLTQQYSLNYDHTFNKIHRVSALALFEGMDYHSNNLSAYRSNLLTPAIDQMFIGSTTGMGNDGSASEMGRVSYVSRVNYSFKDRYLLETIMRADASAKFPKENRWGYFPSVSLGWVISQEDFMKEIRALDNLKLRTSYGQSGNDAVGNFQYLSGYSVGGSAILNDAAQPGIYITGLANPMLTWEKIIIYNAGLDFSFLNKKIYGTGDAFYRERNGIPATRITSLPSTFGSALPPENLNSLNDRGFELVLGTSKTVGDFTYDINGNISWSRSKWNHFEEPVYTDPDQKRINQHSGQWTDRTMGYVSDGLFSNQAEITDLDYVYSDLGGNSSLRPGDVKYKDLNGDGKLDWKDQKDIGKGTMPHWMYGMNFLLKYKNFDFNGLFQGAFGYNTYIYLEQYPNSEEYDLRWTEKNNNANALVPRLGGAGTNFYTSNYRYKSTSYLRLKTASFGYEVPKSLLDKAGISKLRVYVAGTNLLTLSTLNKYGVDPETVSGSIMVYPQQRTISFCLNMSF